MNALREKFRRRCPAHGSKCALMDSAAKYRPSPRNRGEHTMFARATHLPRRLLLALVLGAPLFAAAAEPAIDGKTYTGTLTKQGETQGDPDEFVFKDGKFISTACAGFGFKPASYAITQDGKRMQFSATSETDNGVRMQWKGTIVDDHLEATAQWQRPQQQTVEFRAQANVKH
jgi:hypothetical protein